MLPAELLKGCQVGRSPLARLRRGSSSDRSVEAEAVQQIGGGSIRRGTLYRKASEVCCQMLIEVEGQEHSPIATIGFKRQPVLRAATWMLSCMVCPPLTCAQLHESWPGVDTPIEQTSGQVCRASIAPRARPMPLVLILAASLDGCHAAYSIEHIALICSPVVGITGDVSIL